MNLRESCALISGLSLALCRGLFLVAAIFKSPRHYFEVLVKFSVHLFEVARQPVAACAASLTCIGAKVMI